MAKATLGVIVGNRDFFPDRLITEGRQDIRREITGANVNPRVLVYLPTEEAAAVCAFLPDDFSTLNILRIVNQQRAAFAAGKIFGLMKALRGQTTERAEIFPLVLAE